MGLGLGPNPKPNETQAKMSEYKIAKNEKLLVAVEESWLLRAAAATVFTVSGLISCGGFEGTPRFILFCAPATAAAGFNLGIRAKFACTDFSPLPEASQPAAGLLAGSSLGMFFLTRLLFIPDALASIELLAAEVKMAVLMLFAGAL